MSRNLKYEKDNLINNEEYYYCIKCKNHKVCNGLLPDRWYKYRDRYLCIPCEKMFGKLLNPENKNNGELVFVNNITCLQCNSQSDGVKYPKCEKEKEHYLCLQCFDNNWYAYNNIPEPQYPYSEEIYEEYYQDPEDEKWKNYPLMDVYYQQMTLWHKLKNEILDKYEPLRKCPVCHL
jgi:hypothetical protein